MKSLRRCLVSILAGAVGVTGAWGIAAVGCGGDNSPEHVSGLPDGTTEGSPGEDGQADSLVQNDALQVDVAVQGDAMTEAAPETGTDATAPDADAGTIRAFDGSVANYPAQVAAALCGSIANCCGKSADAATFNSSSCNAQLLPIGFQGSTTGVGLFDGGNIVFNAVAAQACLDDFNQIDCTTNDDPSPVEAQLYKDCFGAYNGTLTVGNPCKGTIECAPGSFCLPQDGGIGDAGAIGTCQSIVGDGGACGLLGSASASQAVCSYRGAGNTGLFCESYVPTDAGPPTQTLGIASWTCAPQEPLGAGCQANEDCASFGCHAHQCATSLLWAAVSTCASFALDAGP